MWWGLFFVCLVLFFDFFFHFLLAKSRQALVCMYGEFLTGIWKRVFIWMCLCALYYELSKQNEYERRKLIIKSQIYNDSNCNNNKHSRWAQCNSFPLQHFFSLSFFSFLSILFSNHFYRQLHWLGFQFPSISFANHSLFVFFSSISISTIFHMTINFPCGFMHTHTHIYIYIIFVFLYIAKFKW